MRSYKFKYLYILFFSLFSLKVLEKYNTIDYLRRHSLPVSLPLFRSMDLSGSWERPGGANKCTPTAKFINLPSLITFIKFIKFISPDRGLSLIPKLYRLK